jgi:hypothetical protein
MSREMGLSGQGGRNADKYGQLQSTECIYNIYNIASEHEYIKATQNRAAVDEDGIGIPRNL